jgi:hypothetical protein
MRLLVEARRCAQYLDCKTRDLPLEIQDMHRAGLTDTDLRWLMSQGFVEVVVEPRLTSKARQRVSHDTKGPLSSRTCFALTDAGAAFAARACRVKPSAKPIVPRWIAERRELRVGGVLVKRFQQPAAVQELIFAVFQEQGWQDWIDDPLPRAGIQDPQKRVHTTVNNLNHNHRHHLLHFKAGGMGTQFGWALR